MYIKTDDSFIPKDFIVHTFYGEKTCFCWNENKLVIFPYTNANSVSAEVLTVPATVKSIECFEGRVFLICDPQGVYKLLRDQQLAVLSRTAIGMGNAFYEVLIPRNKYLYLDNKQEMTSKQLFQLSSGNNDFSQLCIYQCNVGEATKQFLKAIISNASIQESLCVIGDGKKVLTLINENVHIVYDSNYFIRKIVPLYKNCRVGGLLLLTNTDTIIIMYSKDDILMSENIYLGRKVQAIYASFMLSTEDTICLIYSDELKLYYAKKQLLVENVQQTIVQDSSFACFQCFDDNTILGLTVNKQLVEFSIATVERTLSMEVDTFINLHFDMLKGTELIMDKICQRTQELHTLNEILSAEEDKLRRINLYAHTYKIRFYPKILSIHRIANELFLSVNFYDKLPKNSCVVVNTKSKYGEMFCMKQVSDEETVVDTHIPHNETINFSQMEIDLITLKDEEQSWCLIRNFVTGTLPNTSKRKKRKSDKINFINSKIATLQSLIREGSVDMNKLSEIKRSIRKTFNDS